MPPPFGGIMIVIDDLLKDIQSEYIQQKIVDEVPWFWGDTKTNQTDNLYNYQFTHSFYSFEHGGYSNYYQLVEPVVSGIGRTHRISGLSRIKGNLQPVTQERLVSDYHNDYTTEGVPDENMLVGIYYVNSNDGYTEFEDGTIVKSVANRLVLFSNTMKHRGVSQLDTKYRVVLNFNFHAMPL